MTVTVVERKSRISVSGGGSITVRPRTPRIAAGSDGVVTVRPLPPVRISAGAAPTITVRPQVVRVAIGAATAGGGDASAAIEAHEDRCHGEYRAAYGDATPQTILTVPSGYRLAELEVYVTTAWDGTGAAITLGTAGNASAFFAAADTDLTAAATTFAKVFDEAGAVAVRLGITPGAGASAGAIAIRWRLTKEE